jgi:hypothetical protein
MTLPVFPALPGQGWSVKVTPTFSTRIASHLSGREVRVSNYVNALYEFELTFEGLDSLGLYPGLRRQSLQALMGLWIACRGQAGTFLYIDPENYAVGNGQLAIADGARTAFTALRNYCGVVEPVGYLTSLMSVTSNGIALANPTVIAPNTISMPVPPPPLSTVAASFSYAHVCRFISDAQEFEEFMSGLWQVQSLKFRSVK